MESRQIISETNFSDQPVRGEVQKMQKKMHPIGCILVGDSGVGKTSALVTLTKHDDPNYTANIMVDGRGIFLALMDTGGRDDFTRLREIFYPHQHVVVICFSLVDPASFQNVYTKWRTEIRDHCPGRPIVLVGTKLDLRNDEKTILKLREAHQSPISYSQGRRMAKDIKAAKYIECSTREEDDLKIVFEEVSRAVLWSKLTKRERIGIILRKRMCLALKNLQIWMRMR